MAFQGLHARQGEPPDLATDITSKRRPPSQCPVPMLSVNSSMKTAPTTKHETPKLCQWSAGILLRDGNCHRRSQGSGQANLVCDGFDPLETRETRTVEQNKATLQLRETTVRPVPPGHRVSIVTPACSGSIPAFLQQTRARQTESLDWIKGWPATGRLLVGARPDRTHFDSGRRFGPDPVLERTGTRWVRAATWAGATTALTQ